jgi:DNA-binding NarL/FixJ family response regulator
MLKGMKFLFVDDDIQSIYYFRKELTKKGVRPENIVVVESLKEGIDAIRTQKFDYIFIDLYCAPTTPELREYEELLGGAQFNHGQLLGLWIDKEYPKLNYGYTSQVPSVIKYVNDKQREKLVFNKNELSSKEFVRKLEQFFKGKD